MSVLKQIRNCRVQGAARFLPALALLFFGLGGLIDTLVNLFFFDRVPLVSWGEIILYSLTGLTLGLTGQTVWPARILSLITLTAALTYTFLSGIWGVLLLVGALGLVAATYPVSQQRRVCVSIAGLLFLLSFFAFLVPDDWVVSRLQSYAHETHIDAIMGCLIALGLLGHIFSAGSGGWFKSYAERKQICVATGGVALAVLCWFLLAEQEQRFAEQQAQISSVQAQNAITSSLETKTAALQRLHQRVTALWQQGGAYDNTQLIGEAQRFLQDHETTLGVAIVSQDGRIEADYSLSHPQRFTHALSQWPARAQVQRWLMHVASETVPDMLLYSSDNKADWFWLGVALPGPSANRHILVVAHSLEQFLDSALRPDLAAIRFQLHMDGDVLYENLEEEGANATRYLGTTLLEPHHDINWALSTWISPQSAPLVSRLLPDFLFLVCLGFTILLIRTLRLSQDVVQRSDELSQAIFYDYLTGLPNKTFLIQKMGEVCTRARTQASYVSIILLDLNGLKLINDSMGFEIGDRTLREVANRLSHQIQPPKWLARLEGDEFVVVVPDATSYQVTQLARRLIDVIAQPYQHQQAELHLTASAGITTHIANIPEPLELIREADLASTQAKQNGRNTWREYANELASDVNTRLSLRMDLQKALANDHFSMHYQPLINGFTGRITSAEALLRWPHSDRGYVSPAIFVPIAEESGLIVPLSQWVLHAVCRDKASLSRKMMADFPFIINVSPLYFQHPRFTEELTQALEAHNLSPKDIQIEITEGVFLERVDHTINKLSTLRELGFSVSVDDFGTGYSSLSYLKDLPVDKIKIDSSFVSQIAGDRKSAAISKAIIGLAHHLGLKVVAEGVETEAQYWFLKRHFCDEFQGHLFARAMPLDQLELRLREKGGVEALPAAPENELAYRSILILDDEENILNALHRVLRREGYVVFKATNTREAFNILSENPIQVIISDQRLPGMTGTEFFSEIKTLYPATIRIILSGYADLKSLTEAINHGAVYKFMAKPWDDEELRQTLLQAFKEVELRTTFSN
jgi:diguanylate cyclase (GGDEF)-like protein|tara:strand:+ start:159045 stop:162158 length:3114 start_codon:yes stop_codon:yes gene_type:complete